jgi:hypothetical protein
LNVKLLVYDLLGKQVEILVNSQLKPGYYEASWDASNFPSGIYFCRFIAGDFTAVKKMVVIK